MSAAAGDQPPHTLWRWAVVLGVAAAILLAGTPAGIRPADWQLLAIFAATIVASVVRPAPMGSIVFLAICAIAVTGIMTPLQALQGYSDPIVWLVLCAFMISRAIIRTGLGRRIAFLFIRVLGKRSLGLAYSLVATDVVLASIVPSNSARAGGIVFPIARSIAEAYDSKPGETRRRLGAFLMKAVYQGDIVACAMFLTGQASNVIIARFALSAGGVELTYASWLLGSIVPGILSLFVVVYLIYRIFPPSVRHTPEAAELANAELRQMGPMKRDERLTLLLFALVAGLWMTTALHGINYIVIAFLGVGLLMVTRVLAWEDVLSDRQAWDTFIWYGGLIHMASVLGASGITTQFAELSAGVTVGWDWGAAVAVLLLIYCYAHYSFASITAHVTAMFIPFLIVMIAAGAPPVLAVLGLAAVSNLSASLTHYGTTPAPIYFGARYVTQGEWWRIGFTVSVVTVTIWGTIGLAWWKLLGWW
jgi:DASS family divalent anion:Na+ symporter